MKRYGMLAMGLLAVLPVAGAMASPPPLPGSGQPVDERKAQDSLPMASGEVWKTLMQSKITYSAKAPHINATKPPEVKALNGRSVVVDGFMLPIDEGEYPKHFLLSKRTPTCPFCPPGEPNEVIEVYSQKGVYYDDSLLTMQGNFTLINNTENGVFFVMKDANVVKKAKPKYTVPMMGSLK